MRMLKNGGGGFVTCKGCTILLSIEILISDI